MRKRTRQSQPTSRPSVLVEPKRPTPTLPPAFEALAIVLAQIERRIASRRNLSTVKRTARR